MLLQVLCDSSASEVWKLQLLVPDCRLFDAVMFCWSCCLIRLPALCCCYALLQVLCDSSASEVWKLQLLELLVPDWLLLPEQAVQLLGVFDK
jgi:hypothetical protein